MGISNESARSSLIPWAGELLLSLYQRLLSQGGTLDGFTKKNRTWHWSEEWLRAFEELKKAILEELVLALLDHTKPFEVQMDASDFAIGGVLMKEGHPIVFDNQKLNDTERRYTV